MSVQFKEVVFWKQNQNRGNQMNLAGDTNIGQIGDIFEVGDISGSYTAIGTGAQVIVNQIQQALSAVDEMEKDVQVAERRLAYAIQQKIEKHTRLPAAVSAEKDRNPYRSLLDYRIEDAPYFYGRRDAINAMLAKLDQNRLTTLQADSGSGKTSLLQAGLASRLLAAKHLPIHLRPYTEPPHVAIKREFLPDYQTLGELRRFRDDQMSLQGFLRRVTSFLGPRKLFIFLDQFEEFFNDMTPEKVKFVAELQKCVDDQQLNVSWVLSLREEYFGKLYLFEPAVKPFSNTYHLDTFRIEEAHEVITQPALKKGVTYEQGLVDCIVKDISYGADMLLPVHVQLVCSTLYDERYEQSDPNLISAKLYNHERGTGEQMTPGAEGILRSHLNRTVSQQITRNDRKLAWQILRTLVTSKKQRAQRSRQEVIDELKAVGDQTNVDTSSVDKVLQTLENSRLLRIDEDDQGELYYELSHDYLLDEIEVDPQFQAIKLAQEILYQEVPYFREQGVLLAEDRYSIVNSQREFLHIDKISNELLSKSEERLEAERTRELRRAQELAEQREEARRQAVRARRRTQAILGIVSVIALVLLVNTFVIPWFQRYAAKNDKYAVPVPVEMEDGNIVEFEAYEVTNKRYKRCVDVGKCNRPNGFQTIINEWDKSQLLPVVGIDANDALTFCQWIGRTLPTAKQFDAAVLPVDRWPLMNQDQAVFCRETPCQLKPVGLRTISQNPLGLPIFDMVGNASEWTRTIINDDNLCQDSTQFPSVGETTVVFGDDYLTSQNQAGAYISIDDRQDSSNTRWLATGFRCVNNSKEQMIKPYSCPSLED